MSTLRRRLIRIWVAAGASVAGLLWVDSLRAPTKRFVLLPLPLPSTHPAAWIESVGILCRVFPLLLVALVLLPILAMGLSVVPTIKHRRGRA